MSGVDAGVLSKSSLGVLVHSLTADLKTFLRQEIELAKAEGVEKARWLVKSSIKIAAGGVAAFAGLIVFLIGLGWLIAWVLNQAGLQPIFCGFLGLVIIGGLVALSGGLFLLQGFKSVSNGSFAPQRTIQTIQRLKGSAPESAPAAEPQPVPRPSSREMQVQVEETENRMSETLDELGRRLSPHEINQRMKQRISRKPYRTGLVAMGLGLVGGLFLTRDSHH